MMRPEELLMVVHGGGDAAVAAAKELAGLYRWTPCAEGLPEIITESLSEVVLGWRPGEEWPTPAFLALENGAPTWKWTLDKSPTHWMPMPKVPGHNG
jgi:hypothetical protein